MKEFYMTEQDHYHDGHPNGSAEASSDDNSLYDVEGRDPEQAESSKGKRKVLHHFRLLSIFGFISTLMCSWEVALSTCFIPLAEGGRSGLVWVYFATMIMMIFLVASLAEIASMAPSAGGIYAWVAEFAPKGSQRYLGYLVGWTTAMAWQAAAASLNYIAASLIQGLAVMWHPSYSPADWHLTLMTIGIGMLTLLISTFGVKQLPILELLILILHFFGVLLVLIPLWVLAPKATGHDVFLDFDNFSTWSNAGLACLIAQIAPFFALSRADSGTQISDKIPQAPRIIPCSMTAASMFNGALGFAAILTLAFSITKDPQSIVTGAPIGSHPFLVTFLDATSYFGLTTVMASILIFLIIGASISVLATAARHIVAFARDSGLPFASLWIHVSTTRLPGTEAPLNAFALSLTTTVIVALANLGIRDDTLSFALSLAVVFMATGFFLLLVSVLHRRLHGNVDGSHPEFGSGDGLPEARWSLGYWAAPVNVVATGYVLFVFVMAFFPLGLKKLRPNSMNWTALVWAVVVTFATTLYVLHGRYVYRLPIRNRSPAEELEAPAPIQEEDEGAAPSPNI